MQIGTSKRAAFKEYLTNIQGSVNANVAQSYKAKSSISGEAYTGMGFRKKWDGDRFEGKVTATFDIGQKSGNGKLIPSATVTLQRGQRSLTASIKVEYRF